MLMVCMLLLLAALIAQTVIWSTRVAQIYALEVDGTAISQLVVDEAAASVGISKALKGYYYGTSSISNLEISLCTDGFNASAQSGLLWHSPGWDGGWRSSRASSSSPPTCRRASYYRRRRNVSKRRTSIVLGPVVIFLWGRVAVDECTKVTKILLLSSDSQSHNIYRTCNSFLRERDRENERRLFGAVQHHHS